LLDKLTGALDEEEELQGEKQEELQGEK